MQFLRLLNMAFSFLRIFSDAQVGENLYVAALESPYAADESYSHAVMYGQISQYIASIPPSLLRSSRRYDTPVNNVSGTHDVAFVQSAVYIRRVIWQKVRCR